MKLLYVLERYPELSQTFVAQEILGLIELGCEVRVVALEHGVDGLQPAQSKTASDLTGSEKVAALIGELGSAPAKVLSQLAGDPNWPPPSGTRRFRGALRIAAFTSDARWADHVHSHFATEAADIGRLLANAADRPFSFTAHGADAYADQSQLRVNITSAVFARGASAHVADRLKAAANNPHEAAKVVEIPVAVDTERFRQPGSYSPDGNVVAIGRLIEKKGFSTLIEAFANVQNSTSLQGRSLIIAGEGPLRAKLERQSRDLGARVEFLGSQPHERMADLLWAASLFALTPQIAADGDRDGRPTVLIEAMAAGIPVLSTSIPGIDDLINPANGTLARAGDIKSVSDGLVKLLALSPRDLEALGAGGLATSAPYSRAAVAKAMLKHFSAPGQ
ncbi:MAG: glycosyltransferase [Actinomycetes bacterium]